MHTLLHTLDFAKRCSSVFPTVTASAKVGFESRAHSPRLQPAWRMGQRSEQADCRLASGGVRCFASNVALRQMQREGLYDLLFLCSLYSHVYLYTRYSSIRNHEFLEIRIYCLLFWKISSRPAFCSCFTGTV